MNGIHHITITREDQEETYGVRFNNYSNEELKKTFMREGEFVLTEQQLTERIIEKWNENPALLLKHILYAGIVGHSLIKYDVPQLSKEEVGEYLADANPEEVAKIWRAFLLANNIDPSKKESDQKKKKPKAKKRTQKKNS